MPPSPTPTHGPRRARTLAIVALLVLVALGIWFALIALHVSPPLSGQLGSAVTIFKKRLMPAAASTTLTMVSNAPEIIPFGDAPTTTALAAVMTTEPEADAPSAPRTALPTAGQETSRAFETETRAPALYGLPNLKTSIVGVGLATSTAFGGFLASTTIPQSAMGAVKFRIENTGTNASGAWAFSVMVPTSPITIRTFPAQTSLMPGDSIEYVLDFTQLAIGTQIVLITADPETQVKEANENDNSASSQLTILAH